MHRLAFLVKRVYNEGQFWLPGTQTQNGISPQIQKCCDYIQLHVKGKLPVVELAARVGYAKNHLKKKFRQEMGITISTYILSAKMNRAKSLLTGSNIKVQEIVAQLGFLSQSYFCEQFKRATGATSREWRAAYNQASLFRFFIEIYKT